MGILVSVEASFMMMNQVIQVVLIMTKMMTKCPKNDFKIESTNQEKFDFKIQEKMNSGG